ncbi:Thioredoxin-like protein [Gracilaria domingensis]|nr:Thioredoxin-like protein [Gracilaria domingensis]
MLDFLVTTASVADVPLITHIASPAQLDSFVQTIADRPLVLSVSPPSDQFVQAAAEMKASLSPTAAFATVQHPAMLVPNQSDPLIRQLLSRYARLPHIAATASASLFSTSLNWWFENVRDSQSVASFMYTTIRQPQEPFQLSAHDAPLVLQSEQPMLLAFGASDSPTWDDIFFLAHADVEAPSLIPVYMHVAEFLDFAQYVTLDTSQLNVSDTSNRQTVAEWTTQYVIYRSANLNPYISKFGDTVNITGATWLYQQRQLINQTSVYTVAGEVNVLEHHQLQSLITYDARGILLLLYNDNCAKCNKYASYLADVAKALEPHAGFIVVAAVNVQNGLPPLEQVKAMHELPQQLPLVVWASAGERVDVYDGAMSVNAISRYARQRAAVITQFRDGLEWSDVMHAYVIVIGLVLIVVGALLSRRRQRRFVKRYHVT